MKKILDLLTAVAFAAGLIGFVGCGGIEEDPDAAKNEANEAKPNPDDEDPDKESDGPSGEKKYKPKEKKDGDAPDDGEDE